MKDYIVRASAANAQIRAFAAVTTELTEEARKRHETSPVATAALGRLLTGGAMMGSMMKNDTDMLTIQIKCSGPIGGLTVTADSKGNVKGYVHEPNVILPPKNGKLDVGGALGQGVMTVIKDMGLKEPYSGQTILQTGEIAEDLTYYFATSEQVPSSVGLGVLMEKDNTVRCAGGFIVQVMPFIEDDPSEPIDFSDLIEKVYVDGRHTTIEWADGVKTTVGCMEGDHFDEYAGFCAAFVKRLFGGSREARDTFKKHRVVTTKKDRRAGDGRAQSCKHSKDRSNSSH